MFESILGIMALLSGLLHFGFINLYNDNENIKDIPHKHSTANDKYPIQRICCLLLDHAGPRWGKTLAMNCIGTVWALFFVYHFMIWRLFPPMILLKLVNIMTTVLTSAYFLEASYKLSLSDFENWCNDPSHNFLYATVIYWEFILSGIVLLSLIINGSLSSWTNLSL